MSVLNGTTSTTDILKRRRIQSRLKKAEKTPAEVAPVIVNPFLNYAQEAFNRVWGQESGASKTTHDMNASEIISPSNAPTSSVQPLAKNAADKNKAPIDASNTSKVETKPALRSRTTTVLSNVSTSILGSTKRTEMNSVMQNIPICAAVPVLRDSAIRIGQFLQQHPHEAHELNKDWRSFKYTCKVISERLTVKKNNPVRIFPHTIAPLKLISELKKACKENVKELVLFEDRTYSPQQSVEDVSSLKENVQATTSESIINTASVSVGDVKSKTVKPSQNAKRVAKEMKELPILNTLTRLYIECTPLDSTVTQILMHVIESSNIAQLEVSERFIMEGFGAAASMNSSLNALKIFLTENQRNDGEESNQELIDSELSLLFDSANEDYTSNCKLIHLTTISSKLVHTISKLNINSLLLHLDQKSMPDTFDSVPTLASLSNISISACESNIMKAVLHSVCPSTLDTLKITYKSDSEFLLFEDNIVQHLSHIRRLELCNVSPTSIIHLLESSRATLESLTLSFTQEAMLVNSFILQVCKCQKLQSLRILNSNVTNQFFNIHASLKSSTVGLSMEHVTWEDDNSSWDKDIHQENSNQENSKWQSSCQLKYMWFNNVTFKVEIPEDASTKGKAPSKKPAKGQKETGEYNESDADFAALCNCAPLLECLVLKNGNISDAHLEVIAQSQPGEGSASCIRSSLQHVEISNSSKPIQNPKLLNPFPSLRNLYVYSNASADYIQLEAIILLASLCPSIEDLRIVPLEGEKSITLSYSSVFQVINEFANRMQGTMWGSYLKDAIFSKEIMPRVLQTVDTIYQLERDRSRVRNAFQRTSQLKRQQWKGNNEFERILGCIYDAIFFIVGPRFD